MSDQNTQNGGDQSKDKVEWTKPASLFNILCKKFAPISDLQHKQLPSWSILVFLGVLLLVFVWKQIAVNQAESRLEKGQAELALKLEQESTALVKKAREYADSQYNKEEERFGQVLAWAVRGELIRNNLDQIDQYLSELVRTKDTERVVLISDEGKLLVSTDKRLITEDASNLYPKEILDLQTITVKSDVAGKKLLVVPVMGLNKRMATIIISYNPPPLLN
ncbi:MULTISPECIES: hypothetical protein [Nitrosomonas]|uniref:Uncharacterized protein n=2 Tax=Nitrosomonas eutropha TaxID=916 RepID=A0ABX5M7G9_9PROT|nr:MULTISPECIES: hypothetical protein [Nitrosomonas]ABI59520.1 conserved hypothetical protein [Nitrosomonas eutropha C91]MXS79940.1 hypothetical protein [Nitrosomonas sp. GH22]PXV76058.1 hypothetical protein C8R14_13611 [Nitrosomonas eutropha]SDW01901.1 hypothetical protein SAMN05216317_101148 [Nitrosomonas eutropha]SEI79155.1 hypothetical protein SAMN05216318_11151 [Nitrosomonas eutropha]